MIILIPFNRAIYKSQYEEYILETLRSSLISGNKKYAKLCSELMEKKFKAKKILITTSGTAALDMSAILLDIKEGDEVIMPSYTFVSTANAFVLRGAKCVFVDIRPDTMNIDENLIEKAITSKTKAIVVVHYAGVSCEMDKIKEVANKYEIPIVEDAAQGVMSEYKGKALGTIGDLGCYSFHETKNYTMGEGGALVINDEKYIQRAEILLEKGTNRARFFRGEVDKYSWEDIGSSYLQSDINAAYLYGQLLDAEEINENRLRTWKKYYGELKKLEDKERVELPYIPLECKHNSHMFYIKGKDLEERTILIEYLKQKGIGAVFHYVPLHSSNGGIKFGRFDGEDIYTTRESERLLRLPMYYGIKNEEIDYIVDSLIKYYER